MSSRRSRFRKLEKIVVDTRVGRWSRNGAGEREKERERNSPRARGRTRLPRSWMKTIRGIFLTTRGHPGTAVSKDCELNERERDRRWPILLLRSLRELRRSLDIPLVYYDAVYSTVPFSTGCIRAILRSDAKSGRRSSRNVRSPLITL